MTLHNSEDMRIEIQQENKPTEPAVMSPYTTLQIASISRDNRFDWLPSNFCVHGRKEEWNIPKSRESFLLVRKNA